MLLPKAVRVDRDGRAVRKRWGQRPEVLMAGFYIYWPMSTTIQLLDRRWRHQDFASQRVTTKGGSVVVGRPGVSWRASDGLKLTSEIESVDKMVEWYARLAFDRVLFDFPEEYLFSKGVLDSSFATECSALMSTTGVELHECRILDLEVQANVKMP